IFSKRSRKKRPDLGLDDLPQERRPTPMRILNRFWSDDCGALISSEYLFVATILVIGIVVGLTNVREAVNNELTELGNALLTLSQGYTISGSSGSGGSVDGSAATDNTSLL